MFLNILFSFLTISNHQDLFMFPLFNTNGKRHFIFILQLFIIDDDIKSQKHLIFMLKYTMLFLSNRTSSICQRIALACCFFFFFSVYRSFCIFLGFPNLPAPYTFFFFPEVGNLPLKMSELCSRST